MSTVTYRTKPLPIDDSLEAVLELIPYGLKPYQEVKELIDAGVSYGTTTNGAWHLLTQLLESGYVIRRNVGRQTQWGRMRL